MVYKWLVVCVFALYAVPILVYAILFGTWEFMSDVIFGAVSFVFYTPTYLNILNTFALCRIDDISWGTKGLDAEVGKGSELRDSWKSIKIMHVAKYLFWNIIVGTIMLIISSPIDVSGVSGTT
jgi:chitin synthase